MDSGVQLSIDLYPAANGVVETRIASRRPVHASRIFNGRDPDTVLAQVPLVFAVCGVAQSVAAGRALRSALGLEAAPGVDAAQDMLVYAETCREHLWRTLLDWPVHFGEPAASRPVATLNALLPRFKSALFIGDPFALLPTLAEQRDAVRDPITELDRMLADEVFGVTSREWLEISSIDELNDWLDTTDTVVARLVREIDARGWSSLGAGQVSFLPTLEDVELDARLAAADADHFVEAPDWQDLVRETTPLARQATTPIVRAIVAVHGHGLLARIVATLVEIARVPGELEWLTARLASPSPPVARLAANTGIAQVDAARGLLVHRVVLDDGAVRDYQIVAPTEWNFHPHGVLAAVLNALPETDTETLRRMADMVVTAVDPCVGYELEVH